MFPISAPRDVKVQLTNATTLLVTFKSAQNKTGITIYIVSVNESIVCKFDAKTEKEDFECPVDGLKPANLHSVVALSCWIENFLFSCSYGQPIKSWTKPMRESSVSIKIRYNRFSSGLIMG